MREENIDKMSFKELRKEVQLLRDELAVFKRKYEDAIYNLGSENFGKSFTVAQNNMKTQIQITADAIKTTVSQNELADTLKKYSTTEQTAEAITSTVTAEYVDTLISDNYVTNATLTTQIKQTSDQILLTVSETTVSKVDLNTTLERYSTIDQTADKIESTVTKEYVTNLIGEDYVTGETLDSKLSSYSTIEQTASAITSKVTKEYVTDLVGDEYVTNSELNAYSIISQTENTIKAAVSQEYIESKVDGTYKKIVDADTQYELLNSSIEMNAGSISAIVSGTKTGEILGNYLTGITIEPNKITMTSNTVHSTYDVNGLRFFDKANKMQGWSVEPDAVYGGVLNYYVNGGNCYTFGTGIAADGYNDTDMVVRATNGNRGRFVVDVSQSGNKEVKFVGLDSVTNSTDSPLIYANGKLLATQDWVTDNLDGGTVTAVFG